MKSSPNKICAMRLLVNNNDSYLIMRQ